MAIGKFPFSFNLIRGGGIGTVEKSGQPNFLSFTISVDGKKGNESLLWNPTRQEIVENRVIRKHGYSKRMFEAIAGFWAIYND